MNVKTKLQMDSVQQQLTVKRRLTIVMFMLLSVIALNLPGANAADPCGPVQSSGLYQSRFR